MKDRQILADAVAAWAHFLVTEDVGDFGGEDLTSAGILAVNPDLFLAERVTRQGYDTALLEMSGGMTEPLVSPEQLHVRLGRQHPKTVAAHADAFAVSPLPPTHNPESAAARIPSNQVVDSSGHPVGRESFESEDRGSLVEVVQQPVDDNLGGLVDVVAAGRIRDERCQVVPELQVRQFRQQVCGGTLACQTRGTVRLEGREDIARI